MSGTAEGMPADSGQRGMLVGSDAGDWRPGIGGSGLAGSRDWAYAGASAGGGSDGPGGESSGGTDPVFGEVRRFVQNENYPL